MAGKANKAGGASGAPNGDPNAATGIGTGGAGVEKVKRPRTPTNPDEVINWTGEKSRALAVTILQAPGQYSVKQLAGILARNPVFVDDAAVLAKPEVARVRIGLEIARLNKELKGMGGDPLPVRRTSGASTFDRRAMLQELLGGTGSAHQVTQAPAVTQNAGLPALPSGFAGQGTGLVGGGLIPQPGQ